MMRSFANKVAFVTAGTAGIGFALVKTLALRGMHVAFTYRREDRAHDVATWFDGHPECRYLAIKLDVTDRDAMGRAADQVEDTFGKVHVLCNSAGAIHLGPMQEATFQDWDWLLGANLGGVINSIVTFLPRIRAHGEGGHVVNIASMSAFIPGPNVGIYTAAKYAVRGLTESLRLSLADTGIGVSLVCPGLTRSNIAETMLDRPAPRPDAPAYVDHASVARFKAIHSVGMDPMEVAHKVLRGIEFNQLYVFTHSEFRGELQELWGEVEHALPNEDVDPRRMLAEESRRRMTSAARAKSNGRLESE